MNNFLFHEQTCKKCGNIYDSARISCPCCNENTSNESVLRSWKECTPLGFKREIIAILIGYFGLQIFSFLIQLLIILSIRNGISSSGLINDELAFNLFSVSSINSGYGLAAIFFPSYLLLFIIFFLFLKDDVIAIFKRFKKSSTYIGAFIAVVAIIGFNFIYNILTVGLTGGESNQNQNNIVSIVQIYPMSSLIVFGFIGPFCEECTYRLGLTNLLKRFSTPVAYIITGLIFAAIHFDWSNITSALEWINIPPYFFSGLIFAIIYDKFGFGASYLAHAANNIISVLGIII